jgi:hypothetical protein
LGHPGGYKYGNLALQVAGVSDDTVKYDYELFATRTIELLHCKLHTCPFVIGGAPQKEDRKFQTAIIGQEVISSSRAGSTPRHTD